MIDHPCHPFQGTIVLVLNKDDDENDDDENDDDENDDDADNYYLPHSAVSRPLGVCCQTESTEVSPSQLYCVVLCCEVLRCTALCCLVLCSALPVLYCAMQCTPPVQCFGEPCHALPTKLCHFVQCSSIHRSKKLESLESGLCQLFSFPAQILAVNAKIINPVLHFCCNFLSQFTQSCCEFFWYRHTFSANFFWLQGSIR